MIIYRGFFAAGALCGLLYVAHGISKATAQSGPPRLSLKAAAGATELPVGPWGSYSTLHTGPCYLASRRLAPLLSFPIVVGQQRDELLPAGSRAPDGKVRPRPERVALLRRAAGLAPVDAAHDAAGPSPIARITGADADEILTEAHITFAEARLTQEIVTRHFARATDARAATWSAATIGISWSPAFADDGTEGLVVRVSLTNPAPYAQQFFVDILGGLDRPDPLFTLADMSFQTDADNRGVSFRQKKLDTWCALAGQQGDFSTRSLATSGSIFAQSAGTCAVDSTGAASPPAMNAKDVSWALTRLSGISVGPGETRVVAVSVGLGRDSDTALASARRLLALADDRKTGADREGLFTLADHFHERSRYKSGSATIDRLMAQSLVNIPFHDMRRVGAPGRESGAYYRPGVGAWMALGWSRYRPDWAAAQLNAWFLTQTPPQKSIDHVVAAPPTDIIVLWELYQQTHDRDMLERFYPYAVWRFREFLESGRERPGEWLFTWPTRKASGAHAYAPDYSAYVILSAQLLLACSQSLDRPADEQASFVQVIDLSTQALKKSLWDPLRGAFVMKPITASAAVSSIPGPADPRTDTIGCLLPIIIGPALLGGEPEAALRKQLEDTNSFLSPFGWRRLSRQSPAYRPDDSDLGAVRFGDQWLLWKALLDRGDITRASDVAFRLLAAYDAASLRSEGYAERLNGESGLGAGNQDSTADSCALISLQAAYNRPGTVSCGWSTILVDDRYDAGADTLHLVFRALTPESHGVLLCAMGKRGAVYHATGGITGEFRSDDHGAIALPVPVNRTIQQVEISKVKRDP